MLLALAALPGCGGVESLRGAGSGALNLFRGSGDGGSFVSTRVCGVYFDGKTRTAHMRLELASTGRLPNNALVEAEFENPEGGAPLKGSRVFKGEPTLVIFSPPLKGVRQRNYEVVARLYASAEKKQVLGVHTQICQSLVDPRELSGEPSPGPRW